MITPKERNRTIIKLLKDGIKDEIEAINYYNRLINIIPDSAEITLEDLILIREQEKNHLGLLKQIKNNFIGLNRL